MTDIELVTKVFDGLIEQGGCSTDAGGACMYRSPDGRKCAAGLLIRDEDYQQKFEGQICFISENNKTSASKHETDKDVISHKIATLLSSYGYDPAKVEILQRVHDRIAYELEVNNQLNALIDNKRRIISALANGKTLLEIGE